MYNSAIETISSNTSLAAKDYFTVSPPILPPRKVEERTETVNRVYALEFFFLQLESIRIDSVRTLSDNLHRK